MTSARLTGAPVLSVTVPLMIQVGTAGGTGGAGLGEAGEVAEGDAGEVGTLPPQAVASASVAATRTIRIGGASRPSLTQLFRPGCNAVQQSV